MLRRQKPRRDTRRGAILVLVAILMPVFVMITAFAVDVAWMQLVRTELRTATDAASRAGAKTLSMQQDESAARAAAIDAGSRNLVAGTGLAISGGEVQFGTTNQANSAARFVFTAGGSPANAVRVLGGRTSSADGRVNLFFSSIMGTPAFEPSMSATSTVLDRDICVVIDRSGSMGLDISYSGTGNGQNCGPLSTRTRFYALAESVDVFLDELRSTFPDERVALASYSSSFNTRCGRRSRLRFDTSSLEAQLTLDYPVITAAMNDFVQNGIGGSTAIGEGLREGIASLANARPYAVKTIVLMTDGRHNLGVSPESVASEAVAAQTTVHTVTFSPNADIGRMQAVASATGGRHFHADTAGDLSQAFREIARTLPVMVTE